MATELARPQAKAAGVLEVIKAAKPQLEGRLVNVPNMTPDKFVFGIATAVQKNPALLDCEPKSVLLAAYEAAELGVNMNPSLQLAYLIPYGKQCQFQLGYRGMVQKTYETGAVEPGGFFSEIVYERDKFVRQLAPKKNLFHAPADGDRGEPIGAYALVQFKEGGIDFEYLTKEQIETHRKHSKQPDSLMWKTFWQEAWRKTPIRVLWKRLPLINPAMENLAALIEREEERDRDEEPDGRLQLASDSSVREQFPGKVLLYFHDNEAIIGGYTQALVADLPKVGAKLMPDKKNWAMPAARVHELQALCAKKNIELVEPAQESLPLAAEPGASDESNS